MEKDIYFMRKALEQAGKAYKINEVPVGYDDGYVFGGHEIDVDVNSKGEMVCAEMR